jgi:MbtH protein
VTHPFDDEQGEFVVLVNGQGQHSLWPAAVRVPAGWSVAHGPAARQDCLDHVENAWHDPWLTGTAKPAAADVEAGHA